ncbi:Hypothetical_protein [Hexamita inflata]|uniref:Hypothetical_protein n=1 Tax=Hexamita inflata TaxID=28002 RepID=A0AA86N791_9EUKA|nr:Hypothetical protein HINF_LOCUS1783 [Hexamita inflata]
MQMNIQFQNDIYEDSDSDISVLDFERRDFSIVTTQTGFDLCQIDFVFTQTVIIPTCDKCCQTELEQFQQLNYKKNEDDTQLQIKDNEQIVKLNNLSEDYCQDKQDKLNNTLITSADMKSIEFDTETYRNRAKTLKYNKLMHSQARKRIMLQCENNKYEEDQKQRITQTIQFEFKKQDLNYDQNISAINTKLATK